MFGLGGFTLWDFIVVSWYHAWDRVRARFPGAPPEGVVRHEDIRSVRGHPEWREIAGGILIRWHDGEPEMKTSDGRIIESVDIEQSLKGRTKVTDLVIRPPKP